MDSFVFILGRQPEIGLAELRAVFGQVELVSPNVALAQGIATPDIDRLGGTRKVGQVIYDEASQPSKFLVDYIKKLPAGKITLGVSHHGQGVTRANANKTGLYLKKQVGRSMRVLPNSSAEIADAASLGNKLGKSPNKIELLMVYLGHRLVVAKLIGVQNLNAYTFRDRSRPKRDAKVGMLPPKLAQIMINLAAGQANLAAKSSSSELSPRLLDPFCGTGVVLQEALLMGYQPVYGSDINPRMIEYTEENIRWLRQKMHLPESSQAGFKDFFTVADATDYRWPEPLGLVVCETYLGQPYANEPPVAKLRENIATCNLIIEKFLKNLHQQVGKETGICLAVPTWFIGGRKYHLPVVKNLHELGYQVQIKPLVYARDNQIVGRELLVLAKL